MDHRRGLMLGALAILWGLVGCGAGAAPTTPATAAPGLDDAARSLALAGVNANDEWTPHIEEFGGVAMALVPAGCFTMGSSEYFNEQPVHEVCFERPYWIDLTEVTNAQFETYGGQAGITITGLDPERPRESLTWAEAAAYCESRGGRLPTEAEWEFAARGPDGLAYPWGDEFVSENSLWNSPATAPVGSFPAGVSWVGALDMSGNVWEWVSDWYGDYPAGPQVNPQGAETGDHRVLRGGSWLDADPGFLRGAFRLHYEPSIYNGYVGLRCARDFE